MPKSTKNMSIVVLEAGWGGGVRKIVYETFFLAP